MLYQPDLMIYLWMLPVFGLIMLPWLWSLWCMLYRSVERSRLAEIRGFLEVTRPGKEADRGAEKRGDSRIRLEGGKACVSEEIRCCTAYVANISTDGICLKNLPEKMYMEAEKFRVVLKTRQQDYAMFVRPRWKKFGNNGYTIGGEIIRTPTGWRNFISSLVAGPPKVEAVFS